MSIAETSMKFPTPLAGFNGASAMNLPGQYYGAGVSAGTPWNNEFDVAAVDEPDRTFSAVAPRQDAHLYHTSFLAGLRIIGST